MEQVSGEESPNRSAIATAELSHHSFSYDALTVGIGVAIVGATALLYFLTAARDIVVGDTPELITAAVTLGVAHPPGYPLFTLLGHLFSLLPVGPLPLRVNLLAVVCNALTVGMVYLTGLRLSGCRPAAAIGALILAVTPLFWRWSLVSEVFPLNNLLASVLIYLLVAWHESPKRTGVLVGAFFVSGLGLTNHQTIVLLAPAFCFILWRGRAVLLARPQVLVLCALAFCVGLLPYAYVPWASAQHPPYNWGNVSSLRDLARLIARRSYGSGHLVTVAAYTGGSHVARMVALVLSFGPLAGGLTLLGAVYVCEKQRWYLWFSVIAFTLAGPFFVALSDLDLATAPYVLFVLERFFILSHVVLAPLLAFGLLLIAQFIASPVTRRWLITGTGLLALLATVLINYRSMDQSQNHIARFFAEDVFATVAPGTMLLASGDAVIDPLLYLHTVEKLRPDVTLILVPLLPADWYLQQLRERYPDLVIPFDHYDVEHANLKMLIDANKGRPAAVVGTVPEGDLSLDEGFRAYQYGLVMLVEPKSQEHTLPDMISDNERLSRRYRPPAPKEIRVEGFESEILSLYAIPAFQIGHRFERAGAKQEARDWYQRSISVDPYLPLTRAALARVGQ